MTLDYLLFWFPSVFSISMDNLYSISVTCLLRPMYHWVTLCQSSAVASIHLYQHYEYWWKAAASTSTTWWPIELDHRLKGVISQFHRLQFYRWIYRHSAIGVVSYSTCKHDIAVQQQMIIRHIIEQAQTTTLRLESAACSSWVAASWFCELCRVLSEQ